MTPASSTKQQETAQTTPQQEPAGGRRGSYTVLEKVVIDHEPDDVFDAWRIIGTEVKARKDTEAISAVLANAENDGPDAEYVAVPRWRPRKAKVETVTRRSWQ